MEQRDERPNGPEASNFDKARQALRTRAEKIAADKTTAAKSNSAGGDPEGAHTAEQLRKTLHELRVHQIELEMQNGELRQAQLELDAARARYYDLYELAPVGYLTVSDQGLILEANLTAAMLLAAARGALGKQPISRFIERESQDSYYLFRKKMLEAESAISLELRMRKFDGAPFRGRLEGIARQDLEGNTVCRIILSDISERG